MQLGLLQRLERAIPIRGTVDNVVGLHTLSEMCVKMANQLPPSGIGCSQPVSLHLARIHGDGGSSGIADRVVNVLTMHMEDMCVETHVIDVPDDAVSDTHFERRIVGIDKAVDLEIPHMSVIVRLNIRKHRAK